MSLAKQPVFRWSVHNPPGSPSGYPIALSHSFGKGRAIYFSAQMSDHIAENFQSDPWSKRLFLNAVNDLVANPIIRADLPAAVETVLNRQGDRVVLHLLNHGLPGGERTLATSPGSGEVSMNLASAGPIRRVYTLPVGSTVHTHTEGSQLGIRIETLDPVDTTIVFEK
jgi:hypothetical protein